MQGRAEMLRLNVATPVGATLVQRYGIRAVPTLLVFGGDGTPVYVQPGLPDAGAIERAVAEVGT